MELNKFTAEVHENAVVHGWWDEERSFGEIVALCHSELSEALEEYRAGSPMVYHEHGLGPERETDIQTIAALGLKPEGIAVELADCIIRILDWFGKCDIDTDEAMKSPAENLFRVPKNRTYTFGEFIAELHFTLSVAYELSQTVGTRGVEALRLAACILAILAWADANGVDMENILALKHAYNKSRPYRHGGKIL